MTDTDSGPEQPIEMEAERRRVPSWKLLFGLLIGATIIMSTAVALVLIATRNLDAKLALRPEPGLESLSIPEFKMTGMDGAPVTQEVFTDTLTVLEFGFTHCPAACPVMMTQMLRLQDELEGTPARFMFVSVDPAHDTPEQLAVYAQENGVDPDRWTLATGEIETIRRWLTEGLKLSIETQPDSPIELADGTTMANIAHPSHLILIGPDSKILGLYPAFAPSEVDRLAERVKTASKLWNH